jgi:hypothetical protein
MANVTVKTNNVPRDLICYMDLSESEKKDYDFLSEEDKYGPSFFRYHGRVYYMGEFMATSCLKEWHGVANDSYFSGVCVRYTKDLERVVVGSFYS